MPPPYGPSEHVTATSLPSASLAVQVIDVTASATSTDSAWRNVTTHAVNGSATFVPFAQPSRARPLSTLCAHVAPECAGPSATPRTASVAANRMSSWTPRTEPAPLTITLTSVATSGSSADVVLPRLHAASARTSEAASATAAGRRARGMRA